MFKLWHVSSMDKKGRKRESLQSLKGFLLVFTKTNSKHLTAAAAVGRTLPSAALNSPL